MPTESTILAFVEARSLGRKNSRTDPKKTLGNLMWGCALTQTGTTKMFDEFSRQALLKLDNFSCRDVGNFLWGMVNVRYQHHELLQRMLSYCANRLHEFDADSIALAMWALSSVDGVDGVSDMVKRSFVPLSESVHYLSGSGCAKMWHVVGKLNLYHARFTENLDERTEYWCHVLLPEEVANVLLACSILRYEPNCMLSLLEQAFLIIENMENNGSEQFCEEDNEFAGTSRPSTSKSRNAPSRPSTKGSFRSIGKSRPNTAASSDLLLEAATIEHNESKNDESNARVEKKLDFDDANVHTDVKDETSHVTQKDPDILLHKKTTQIICVSS